MPFTPIHLGPGLAFKAIGGRRFSFMVFGGAQVLMDIEPLLGILRGWPVLHGPTHTVWGALPIGLLAGAIGRPISAACLRSLRIPHAPFTWPASFAGALLGTYSHVLLDAIMHSDLQPVWPLSPANPLLRWISVDQLHLACMALGLFGVAAIVLRAAWNRLE
ncbi:hypothetical protein ASD78_15095 [Lysobacter sp. Root667]|uniref:metal-dependent hydrolase n=1 Tax=Lysobacter sp. Root667 TaxID=1736581 RepID=UPI0006FBAE53|nr:hypothetical protein [Lysobacter sp. Root667]KRA72937.1 hypothetical protein ASD78_15095 [Lysobacter sp. Root667]